MIATKDIWNYFALNEDNHAICNRCEASIKYNSRHGPNNLRNHINSFRCKEHIVVGEEKRKPSPHDVWNFFTLIQEELAKCKNCGKEVTYRSTNGPGNLKAHLKTVTCKNYGKEIVEEELTPQAPPPPVPHVVVLPKIDPKLFENILFLLKNIVIYDNKVRYNIPKHKSLHFGLVNRRDNFIAYSITSRKYISLYNELILIGKRICPVKFTTITVLKNTVTGKHKDRNNYGATCIVSIGDYSGCTLFIEGQEFNAKYQPLVFDGYKYEHWNTDDLVGDKYSLVFYSIKNNITDQIEVIEDEYDDEANLKEMCLKEKKDENAELRNELIISLQQIIEKIKLLK